MALKLTKKQKRLMDFLQDFQNNHDYSPSYREIAAGLGLRSVASVAEHIDKRNPGSARSLEIVDLSFPETTALFKQRLEFISDPDREVLLEAAQILGLDLES